MTRASSVKKRLWPTRHYLDTEAAISFLGGKVEQLAAIVEISQHVRKFALDKGDLLNWVEELDKQCGQMSGTLAAVGALADKDDLVLMTLDPRGRQMLKKELASAVGHLQSAEILRDRLREMADIRG